MNGPTVLTCGTEAVSMVMLCCFDMCNGPVTQLRIESSNAPPADEDQCTWLTKLVLSDSKLSPDANGARLAAALGLEAIDPDDVAAPVEWNWKVMRLPEIDLAVVCVCFTVQDEAGDSNVAMVVTTSLAQHGSDLVDRSHDVARVLLTVPLRPLNPEEPSIRGHILKSYTLTSLGSGRGLDDACYVIDDLLRGGINPDAPEHATNRPLVSASFFDRLLSQSQGLETELPVLALALAAPAVVVVGTCEDSVRLWLHTIALVMTENALLQASFRVHAGLPFAGFSLQGLSGTRDNIEAVKQRAHDFCATWNKKFLIVDADAANGGLNNPDARAGALLPRLLGRLAHVTNHRRTADSSAGSRSTSLAAFDAALRDFRLSTTVMACHRGKDEARYDPVDGEILARLSGAGTAFQSRYRFLF